MMGKQGKNGISWTDISWNPVTGCTRVSAGCEHCYAARYARRHLGDFKTTKDPITRFLIERLFSEVRTHPDRLELPLHWRRPRRIFVCSMGDLFHEQVPDLFINRVMNTVDLARQDTFIVLTKRPKRMHDYFMNPRLGPIPLPGDSHFISTPRNNLWLLVSVENQKTADERIPILLDTPAVVRGISIEPMLGPVDIKAYLPQDCAYRCPEGKCTECNSGFMRSMSGDTVDWVIVGGETGPGARPLHPDWVRSIRDECQAAGVPFHFKGWGEWAPDCLCASKKPHGTIERPKPGIMGCMFHCGKKAAGRILDGREWMEFPS